MKNRSLTLMQHHDGELDPEQTAELEESLSEEDAAVLDGLNQLGDVVRAHGEARSNAADSIADDVLAELEVEGGRQHVAALLRVIEGGGGASEPAPPEPVAESAPPPRTLADNPKDGRAGRIFLALSLAAAVALGVRAIATTDYTRPPERPVAAVVEPTPAPVAEAEAEDSESELSAAAIESIDFGNQTGAIFMVSAGAQTTPVVWVSDDPQSGDRIEPL